MPVGICRQRWMWMPIDAFFLCAFTSAICLNQLGLTLGHLGKLEIPLWLLELLHLPMDLHWRRLVPHLFVKVLSSLSSCVLAQTMLAAIKMEVMTPTSEAPDEGCIAIDFHMPPICSPIVRPGRPAEAAPVVSKQLSDTILSSGMINLKELSLVSGKAAWMAYLDVYCLDADGALFDAALLAAVAAFAHLQIPVVSLNDDGRVVIVSEDNEGGMFGKEAVNKEKRKLNLTSTPFSLTCILHKNYILADPTAEEESIMETVLTVVLDSSFQLVSLYKPGGPVLAHTSVIQDCVALTRQRVKELQEILSEAISDMEVD